jgi:hypothetical protein
VQREIERALIANDAALLKELKETTAKSGGLNVNTRLTIPTRESSRRRTGRNHFSRRRSTGRPVTWYA